MALFIPGPLLGGISGNLGGVNFTHGKYGPYVRTIAKKTNKHTPLQYESRRKIQRAATWWAELAEDDRQAWRAAAGRMLYRNRMGMVRLMSGYQLFCEMFMEHWPSWFIPEEIVKNIRGRCPPPVLVSATFREAGPWHVTTALPTGALGVGLKYFLSRPVKSHALRSYSDWFLRAWYVGFNNIRIYDPFWDPDPRIDTTKAGEVIGLQMKMVLVVAEGIMIFSKPSTSAVTVI